MTRYPITLELIWPEYMVMLNHLLRDHEEEEIGRRR